MTGPAVGCGGAGATAFGAVGSGTEWCWSRSCSRYTAGPPGGGGGRRARPALGSSDSAPTDPSVSSARREPLRPKGNGFAATNFGFSFPSARARERRRYSGARNHVLGWPWPGEEWGCDGSPETASGENWPCCPVVGRVDHARGRRGGAELVAERGFDGVGDGGRRGPCDITPWSSGMSPRSPPATPAPCFGCGHVSRGVEHAGLRNPRESASLRLGRRSARPRGSMFHQHLLRDVDVVDVLPLWCRPPVAGFPPVSRVAPLAGSPVSAGSRPNPCT